MAISIDSGRIIRQDITDENGAVLGQIAYNPNDIKSLDKFWGVYDTLHTGSQRQKELEAEFSAMDAGILDEMETAEEFERGGRVISKGHEIMRGAIQTVDEVKASLDEVFGKGTCDFFMQGYADVEMLTPLLDAVMPDFEAAAKERKAYLDKYRKNREQRRAEKKTKANEKE